MKTLDDYAADLYGAYVGENGTLNGLPAPAFGQLTVDEQARWKRVAIT